jgi:tungstate transport system substrate-binding protein
MRRLSILLTALILIAGCARSHKKTRIVLAATTSLEDSGLLDMIAEEFAKAHPEIELSPVAVGTGEAIALGERGDADVIISHDSASEMALVTAGRARERRSLMQNDFVIAGGKDDAAHIRGSDAVRALTAISEAKATFISRGDDSGTHRKEMKLWKQAGVDPRNQPWYIEAAVGMGDALLLANQRRAYILTDRATYLRFYKRLDLDVLSENDPRLLNKYGVTVLKGSRSAEAKVFADWLTSTATLAKIRDFGMAEFGRSLFIPTVHGAVPRDTIPTGER